MAPATSTCPATVPTQWKRSLQRGWSALSPTGLDGPYGLAFDAAGNLYVANGLNGTVSEVTPAGVVSTFATGLNGPYGLVFDTAGNLYVANTSGNSLSEVTPAGVVSTFASGFAAPVGLAIDATGNLYLANASGNTVSEVTEVPNTVTVPFILGGSGVAYNNVTASPLTFTPGQTSADYHRHASARCRPSSDDHVHPGHANQRRPRQSRRQHADRHRTGGVVGPVYRRQRDRRRRGWHVQHSGHGHGCAHQRHAHRSRPLPPGSPHLTCWHSAATATFMSPTPAATR